MESVTDALAKGLRLRNRFDEAIENGAVPTNLDGTSEESDENSIDPAKNNQQIQNSLVVAKTNKQDELADDVLGKSNLDKQLECAQSPTASKCDRQDKEKADNQCESKRRNDESMAAAEIIVSGHRTVAESSSKKETCTSNPLDLKSESFKVKNQPHCQSEEQGEKARPFIKETCEITETNKTQRLEGDEIHSLEMNVRKSANWNNIILPNPDAVMALNAPEFTSLQKEQIENVDLAISNILKHHKKAITVARVQFETTHSILPCLQWLPPTRADFLSTFRFFPSVRTLSQNCHPLLSKNWIFLAEIISDEIESFKLSWGIKVRDREGITTTVHLEKRFVLGQCHNYIRNIRKGNTIAVVNGPFQIRMFGSPGNSFQVPVSVIFFNTSLTKLFQASVLFGKDRRGCWGCESKISKIFCDGCCMAVYCTRKCQGTHWMSEHYLVCRSFPILLALLYLCLFPNLSYA